MINAAQALALLASFLGLFGETVTMSRGGVNTTYTALCEWAPRSFLRNSQEEWFDDNEVAGLTQPVLALWMAGNAANVPQILDTFTRDGRSFTVRKVGPHRLSNTIIAYIVFAD